MYRRTLLAASVAFAGRAWAADTVRLGQATTSLSFLPVWASRARDDWAAQGLALTWASIPGGDPAALAALDSSDIDLAAVGGETALAAIAKGQPFTLVMSLMSRMSLDLVVGPAVSVETAAPLAARLAALKGLTVGVSAVGGTQDRAVRWLAAKAGLGRDAVRVAAVGAPPALQAALENKRVDAFVLSPPEAQIAAAGGYGRTLIGLATDFPALREMPFLALVARSSAPDALVGRSVRALQAGAAAVETDAEGTSALIAAKFFPRIAPALIAAGVMAMRDGVAGRGAMTQAGIDAAVRFADESGAPIAGVPANAWTNRFVT